MRFRATSAVALALVVGGVVAGPVSAAISVPYAPISSDVVAVGVRHERGTLVAGDSTQHVNVAEIDTGNPGIGVRLAQAHGIATRTGLLTDAAFAYEGEGGNVVAAVNGSTFFYLTSPDGTEYGATGQGLNVSDGELINAGFPDKGEQSQLAFGVRADGTPVIGAPGLEILLALPGGATLPIDRINQKRLATNVVLYTPRFDTHTWTDALGDEYLVEGLDLPLGTSGTWSGTIVEVHDGSGDTAIGPGQVVISIAASAPSLPSPLAVGDEVSVSISIDPAWANVVNSVGGRNVLVIDGESVVTSARGRHPRTAVGIRPDGTLLLLTADSGLLDGGAGMNLIEMAALMLALGAVDALNLDGGNSSQLAVRPPGEADLSLANADLAAPDDRRRVANALQVVSDGPAVIDGQAPTVEQPQVSLAATAKVGKRRAAIEASWAVSDSSTITDVEVEWQTGTDQWQSVGPFGASASSAILSVPFERPFRLRARATDSWGNTSEWTLGPPLVLRVHDESSTGVTRVGGWKRRTSTLAFGGAYRRSRAAGASMTLPFSGLQVAVVGLSGPSNGAAEMRLNGALAATVPTFSSSTSVRRVLFVSPLAATASEGATEIEVRNAGTIGSERVEIDAFLVLQAVEP